MTIFYNIDKSLYVNITNKCPCSCVFCIRQGGDSVGGSDSLWLEQEPTFEMVKSDLDKINLDNYDEVVFCGYGEPLERIDLVVRICDYIRNYSNIKLRVNTNGLSDLIHNKKTAISLKGKIDSVSISLNAPDEETYNEVTRPRFGRKSFQAMLDFAIDCKKYIGDVKFSVVDILTKNQIQNCEKLSNEMKIPLKIRHKV